MNVSTIQQEEQQPPVDVIRQMIPPDVFVHRIVGPYLTPKEVKYIVKRVWYKGYDWKTHCCPDHPGTIYTYFEDPDDVHVEDGEVVEEDGDEEEITEEEAAELDALRRQQEEAEAKRRAAAAATLRCRECVMKQKLNQRCCDQCGAYKHEDRVKGRCRRCPQIICKECSKYTHKEICSDCQLCNFCRADHYNVGSFDSLMTGIHQQGEGEGEDDWQVSSSKPCPNCANIYCATCRPVLEAEQDEVKAAFKRQHLAAAALERQKKAAREALEAAERKRKEEEERALDAERKRKEEEKEEEERAVAAERKGKEEERALDVIAAAAFDTAKKAVGAIANATGICCRTKSSGTNSSEGTASRDDGGLKPPAINDDTNANANATTHGGGDELGAGAAAAVGTSGASTAVAATESGFDATAAAAAAVAAAGKEVVTVQVEKQKGAKLGFTISEMEDKLVVTKVKFGGLVAGTDLTAGMEIFSVNGSEVAGKSSAEAARMLVEAMGTITIIAFKEAAVSTSSSSTESGFDAIAAATAAAAAAAGGKEVVTVQVEKQKGAKLGLTISEMEDKLVVTKVKEAGLVAGTDLTTGTEIFSINGTEVAGKSSAEAAGMLVEARGTITIIAFKEGNETSGLAKADVGAAAAKSSHGDDNMGRNNLNDRTDQEEEQRGNQEGDGLNQDVGNTTNNKVGGDSGSGTKKEEEEDGEEEMAGEPNYAELNLPKLNRAPEEVQVCRQCNYCFCSACGYQHQCYCCMGSYWM